MQKTITYLLVLMSQLLAFHSHAQETAIQYLSGTGSDDTVNWQFYCTKGSNSGKWSNIAVPSCWELQGFGKYDYGFAKDSLRGKEQGLYKHVFTVPGTWKGKVVNIVFEGVMTDAEVKVNGKLAGPIHQGAYYAFKYDISKLLQYGKQNTLEVTVAKHSANASVNEAERKADFWIFGGIFRPVYLEALPPIHIAQVTIDAKADGSFLASINTVNSLQLNVDVSIYDAGGKLIVRKGADNVSDNRAGLFLALTNIVKPKPWSAEFPNLYTAVFSIMQNDKPVHTIRKKFGFRTIEVKQRDGIYINGQKIKFKGVNRHSFWPTTGRTTSKALSIADVQLIKEMNMNAVRMSHYPPDAHFLDVCDSLGLYVMDELAGWHGNYDTPTGEKLLKEMIDHDEHHPSIIFWANGNEGGHNFELDHLFTDFDLQRRPVVHPWQLFGGIETQHYREYNYGIGNYENGREIVIPTEFLHGQFDGGHGAGLEDYWEKMWHNPLSAGGFLWDFADQGVVRKDLNDSIDTDKHRGADGIVGPYREKEASFFTIKEVWSPIHFERKEITPAFDGRFNIENRYDFTNINQCSFNWKLVRFDFTTTKEVKGNAVAPNIRPHEKGVLQLDLPKDWNQYDVLYITAKDLYGKELFTWSFTITRPQQMVPRIVQTQGDAEVQLTPADSVYIIKVKDLTIKLHQQKGTLVSVENKKGLLPFSNGPVVQEGANNFAGFTYRFEGKNLVITSVYDKKKSYNTLQWTIYPSGWIKMEVHYFPAAYFTDVVGVNFSLPEKEIKRVSYMGFGPYRVWKNRLKGNHFGVFHKTYNNTETGESWNYPEFKGYHANFYGGYFYTGNQKFTVVTENEDLFLRLYSAAWKTDQWHNYEPIFPNGDISFMHGISSIGTKTQRNETTGPMGMKNIFYDYEKDPSRALKMVLYFDFKAE